MNTQPKVSIIIPVYNAESYLHACLNSAVQQSLKEIQIICVDDCSTDSSPEILQEFAKSDARINVLKHDSNKGEGAARNTGLDHAHGDYIFNLDQDDTIPPNALEILYTEARNHGSELVKGGHDIVHQDGEIMLSLWSNPDRKIINTNIFESGFLQKIPAGHWTYLYRRVFLNENNIRYRTDLIGLDLVALTTALLHASTVTLLPDIIYHYHQSETSITRGSLSTKIAEDAIKTKIIIADMLKLNGLQQAASSYLQSWDYIISTQWLCMPISLPPKECSEVFSRFRELIIDENIAPWKAGTPHHYRYILALVLSGRDEEALAFLSTTAASEGFPNQEELVNSLDFVLTQVPGDVGSLTELARIAREEGDLERALSLFQEAIKTDSHNFGVYIQTASILKELGRYDQSHDSLDTALDILIKGLDTYEDINTVKNVKNNITQAEKNALNKKLELSHEELSSLRNEFAVIQRELNTTREELKEALNELSAVHGELNLVYSSTSWRITKPFRKLVASLKFKR
jgi:glycosyltransferase involved in cell wall biosynthesis